MNYTNIPNRGGRFNFSNEPAEYPYSNADEFNEMKMGFPGNSAQKLFIRRNSFHGITIVAS